jgi:hypothetical protein
MESRDYASSLPTLPASGVEIRPLERGEEAAWDQFVTSSASSSSTSGGGTFFHLSGWKTVIENSRS